MSRTSCDVIGALLLPLYGTVLCGALQYCLPSLLCLLATGWLISVSYLW